MSKRILAAYILNTADQRPAHLLVPFPINNIHPQYSPRSIAENIWVYIFDMSLNRPTTLFVFSIFSKPG